MTQQETAYIDMNGDGLPDHVNTSGGHVSVRLNYGYGWFLRDGEGS